MSINYAALKIEIAKPAYNGMSDATIAATINAQTVPGFRSFQPTAARLVLMLSASNDWGWLSGVADGSITSANASGGGAVAVNAATRRVATTVRDLFSMPLPVDITDSGKATLVNSALTALVNANIIVAATQTALQALPAVTNAGWAQFGERSLDYNDIAIARAS